jgi:hypothetical protein
VTVGCGEGSGHSESAERPANKMLRPASEPSFERMLNEMFQLSWFRNTNSTLRLSWLMGKSAWLPGTLQMSLHTLSGWSHDTRPSSNGSVGLSQRKPRLVEVKVVLAPPPPPLQEVAARRSTDTSRLGSTRWYE